MEQGLAVVSLASNGYGENTQSQAETYSGSHLQGDQSALRTLVEVSNKGRTITDVSTSVEQLIPIHKLPCSSERRDPGGGGINVARVVKRLGADVTAMCFTLSSPLL